MCTTLHSLSEWESNAQTQILDKETQYGLKVEDVIIHLESATCILVRSGVEHSSIFALFSSTFSHIDKKGAPSVSECYKDYKKQKY